MKTIKFFLPALAVAAALLCSCTKDEPIKVVSNDGLNIETVEPDVVDVTCNGFTGGVTSMTRTGANPTNTTTVHDLTIWSYDASGNLAKTFFSTTTKGLSLYDVLGDTWASGRFTVLILANMGDKTSSAPAKVSDARNIKFDVSNFKSGDYFPLYGIHENVSASTVSLTVKRIISQYNFTFTQNADNGNYYHINKFHLCNMSKYIRPFNEGYKATSVNDVLGKSKIDDTSSDYFTCAEIDAVNNGLHSDSRLGGPVTVYAFENMQGEINAKDIKTKKDKTLGNISGYEKLCTFFEAELSVSLKDKPTAYEKVYFRWLFGYGEHMLTYNFDVPRNIIFNITVNFDEENIEGIVDDFNIAPEEVITLVPHVNSDITVGNTQFVKADICRNGIVELENCDCAWQFGSKVTYNNTKKTITGKAVGDEKYTCSATYNGMPLKASGTIAVDDLKIYFERNNLPEDEESPVKVWGINCNDGYKLINVDIAIDGSMTEDMEDAELDEMYFSSTNPNAVKYGWKNVQTGQLSNFVPSQEVDEEFVAELWDSARYVYRFPYVKHKVAVTYRRSSDPSGSYRSQNFYYDSWPN